MTSRWSVNPSSGLDVACDVANVTTTDSDTSHYLQDPELFADVLPQPFRRIDRIVNSIVDGALDIAEANESKLIHDCSRRQAPKYDSADILEELTDVVCITASPNGKFVFVSNSHGCLHCVDASHREVVAVWKPDNDAAASAVLTSLNSTMFSDDTYLIAAVDHAGAVKLFIHIGSVIVLAQTLNDQDDASRKSLVSSVEVSSLSDFVGLVTQSASDPAVHAESSPVPAGDASLEVYRLPKDAWIKELEPVQQMLEQAATLSDEEQSSSMNTPVPAVKFSPLSAVLKLRPPAKPTGMVWSSAHQALKSVEAAMQDHVIGSGLNHLVSKQHLELRGRAFESLHRQHASLISSVAAADASSSSTPRPTFHFLTPCKLIPHQSDTHSVGGANSTMTVAVWWTGCSHVLHYSLLRPLKDIEAGVAELVWPMSSPVVASAVSQCSTLMAVALANNDVVVWNRDTGLCARTAKVNLCGCGTLSSLQFIDSHPAAAAAATCPSDRGLGLIIGSSTGHVFTLSCTPHSTQPAQSVYIDVEYESEIPERIQPVPGMPELVVLCCKDGRVFVCDVVRCQLLCELVKPSVDVATLGQPLQPLSITAADGGRTVYAVVNLPADQLGGEARTERGEEDHQETDVDEQRRSHSDDQSDKSLLLAYRIMYYPTFDWYTFASQSKSTLVVPAASRPALDHQVNTALQARLSEQAERRSRLAKRWFELKELFTQQSDVQTKA